MSLSYEEPRIDQYAFIRDYLYPVQATVYQERLIPSIPGIPSDLDQVIQETHIPNRMTMLFSTPAAQPWDRVSAYHLHQSHLFPDVIGEIVFNGHTYSEIEHIAVQCFPHILGFINQAFGDETLRSNSFMVFYPLSINRKC